MNFYDLNHCYVKVYSQGPHFFLLLAKSVSALILQYKISYLYQVLTAPREGIFLLKSCKELEEVENLVSF